MRFSICSQQFEGMLEEVKNSGLIEASKVDEVWFTFLADQRGSNWTRPWLLGVLGAWLRRMRG